MGWALGGLVALALTLGASSGEVPDRENFRGNASGGNLIDVVGSEGFDSSPPHRQAAGGDGGIVQATGGIEGDDYCPPVLYTYGKYSMMAPNCNGELGGTEFTPWYETVEAEEAEDGDPVVGEPVTLTREDVQSLLVDAGGLEIQPDRSWVLVHVETIAFTGAREQILTTTVLDAPVEVRVTPQAFTWDFGDGSEPLVTTDPGAPWPEHTVAHSYTAAQDSTAVTVRTEWDAVFRIPGVSPWLPVAGTVVTTESSEPFEVVTATPRLVAGSR